MSEIKGYTPEEVAEAEKEKCISLLNDTERIFRELKQYESLCEEYRSDYTRKRYEYRMKSVNRVLRYICSKKITDEKELNTLLTHCQNKLNGNVDGLELDLKPRETDILNDITEE